MSRVLLLLLSALFFNNYNILGSKSDKFNLGDDYYASGSSSGFSEFSGSGSMNDDDDKDTSGDEIVIFSGTFMDDDMTDTDGSEEGSGNVDPDRPAYSSSDSSAVSASGSSGESSGSDFDSERLMGEHILMKNGYVIGDSENENEDRLDTIFDFSSEFSGRMDDENSGSSDYYSGLESSDNDDIDK